MRAAALPASLTVAARPLAGCRRASRPPVARVARHAGLPVRASLAGSDSETSTTSGTKPSIKQTMADLDALLGIEEEEKQAAQVGRCGWVAAPPPLPPPLQLEVRTGTSNPPSCPPASAVRCLSLCLCPCGAISYVLGRRADGEEQLAAA